MKNACSKNASPKDGKTLPEWRRHFRRPAGERRMACEEYGKDEDATGLTGAVKRSAAPWILETRLK